MPAVTIPRARTRETCLNAQERRRTTVKRVTLVRIAAIHIAVSMSIPLFPLAAAAQVPEEARRQLQEALGAPFVVFRESVQDDLKVTDEQKKALEEEVQAQVQDAMELFQKLEGVKPEEREKELAAYRPKAHMKLAALLTKTLTDDQLKRLRQVELQLEGLLALGRPDVGNTLKLADEQRKQFVAVMRDLEKSIAPLIKEAQSGGNPDEIRP